MRTLWAKGKQDMNHLRNLKALIGAMVLGSGSAAFAQNDAIKAKYYPEASLVQIYNQQQIEQKKAEDMEQKAVQDRDLYEKQRRDVETQVANHRFQIEGLKMRQEKAQSELDLLAVDLQHVNGDLSSYQAEHQQLQESSKATLYYLETQRTELAAKQKALTEELAALAATRQKAEREVYTMAMDIERFRNEIARGETRVQEAEAKRAALDADEMKVRAEWVQTKMAAAEHMRQRDDALAQLAETKKRFEQAQKELTQSKQDLAKAEQGRNDTSRKVQGDVARYESDILAANKKRIGNEAENIRLESEVLKIKDYASRLKESRDQSIEQSTNTDGLVLKSSLALETARSALTSTVEGSDQKSFRAEKVRHQARGLAAAEEASHLVDGGRIWITDKNCNAFGKPGAKEAAGFFGSGKRLLAKDHGSRWVEVLNGTGSSVFIKRDCGHYGD